MKQILSILPSSFHRRAVVVALTLLIRALLNLAGLALFLPVLALVLEPTAFEEPGILADIYRLSGCATPQTFAIWTSLAVVAAISTKCLINWLLARVERRFIYDLYRNLSRRLYVVYHDRGLPFIKQKNTAYLARNINVVTLSFTSGILMPTTAIAVEGMLLVLIFGAMLCYAPMPTLMAAAVLLPAAFGYYYAVRGRINHYGEAENKAQREKSRLVFETFRGFADIELSNAFPLMLNAFDRVSEEVIRTRSKEADINQLPTMVTEIGLAVGMALLIAIGLGMEGENLQLLFGIFAVAALRLMPSVRRIMSSWTSLRYNRYTIDILRDALDANDTTTATPAREVTPLPFNDRIEVRDLSFTFPDSETPLFERLTLEIHKGERLGIRGRSGSGKTTLFNLLLGLYEPTDGAILIDGVKLDATTCRAWQQRLGYVSQSLFIADATFAENIALGVPPEEIDHARVAEVIEAAQLGTFINALPHGADTRVGECGCRLSGGQRQRIGIARALYRKADVLFFDEATSALDSLTEQEINQAIQRIKAADKALTILIIAHRETSLDGCDRIITLEHCV